MYDRKLANSLYTILKYKRMGDLKMARKRIKTPEEAVSKALTKIYYGRRLEKVRGKGPHWASRVCSFVQGRDVSEGEVATLCPGLVEYERVWEENATSDFSERAWEERTRGAFESGFWYEQYRRWAGGRIAPTMPAPAPRPAPITRTPAMPTGGYSRYPRRVVRPPLY